MSPAKRRRAAARALGELGLEASVGALRELLDENEADELRSAAAVGLVTLGAGESAIPTLVELLRSPNANRWSEVEDALEAYLSRLAGQGSEVAHQALADWVALSGPPGIQPTPEEDFERRARRAQIVEDARLGS